MIRFATDSESPLWQGVFYSFIFMLVNIFQSLCSAYQQNRMILLSLKVKSVLTSTIFRKSLLLSMDAKKKYTTGEIVNLMAVDSQRFVDIVPWICFLWTGPLQILIGFILLWQELGPSVIGGVALLVAFIPLNSIVAGKVKKIQRKQMKIKDQRLKTINEMLNGIKVLKLYAWENAFVKNISKMRLLELKIIRKSGFLSAIFICFGGCSPFLVAAITFTLYVCLTGESLTAEKAFVSIALFNLLRIALALIPNMISSVILTIVSVKRIGDFLNQSEIEDYITRIAMPNEAVKISNASFSWEYDSDSASDCEKSSKSPIVLSNINVNIPKHKLIAIVGPVGSGKSSFLYSLLGEMHKLKGVVNIDADQKIAYVSQQAWIQNLSLRDNILFGKSFDHRKYYSIIKACALEQDIHLLGGDQIEIGEKGINLSGGQKQRISIARACYSDSDLFLFDDPLSAVDSHVGKHIFERVLSNEGILQGKTRILLTNALYVLPMVDEIILLKNGHIEDVGDYKNLMESNENFRELIKNFTQSHKNDETVEEEIIDECDTIIDEFDENIESQVEDEMIEADLLREINKLPRSVSVDSSSHRKGSKLSLRKRSSNLIDSSQVNPQKLIESEKIETGSVSIAIYRKFFKAMTFFWCFTILFCFLASTISNTVANLWLASWTDKVENAQQEDNSLINLYIYLGIGSLQIIFLTSGWISIVSGSLHASKSLHRKLLASIAHAPMNFFDTTPIGRILNRFSKDIDVLDNYMQLFIRIIMNHSLQVCATLFIICYQTPIFLAFILPFMIIYFFIQRFFVATSRQLKRIESVSRSPIFSHFSETIQGSTTIKAYNASERFISESEHRIDENQKCFYPSQVANCWLQVRLEFLANCLIFFTSLMMTLNKDNLTSSSIGLSLSYALNITLSLNWCVRIFAEIENNVVSVERISEYTDVVPEAPWEMEKDTHLEKSWPSKGRIEFSNYATRYRPGLDLVLKGIDFSIRSGEKIGIVGRTGAGKSSLTLALFRLIESCQGSILIDKVKTSDLGLHKLRTCLTIIPQDPVLFCGTLRFNLDPFDEHSDQVIWKVLELSHLKSFAKSLEDGLEYKIVENGENLSLGQKQLICLARALLRRTKILILDEATAAVDLDTDSLIQMTIRKEFSDCTVLTIAHRIHTILDSDRVLVLDAGKVIEFDTPNVLLEDKKSVFYSLAKNSGLIN
ncbi:ABC transporter sub-family C-like protein 7 [Sarcoptes scabiei]|uniref:ABC-type glutathione-S-conjugate transporter n=1 Tax=Sarcoptes scabiei TaxID=52283 RepID=A0A132AAN4_SARSC|nr:ABC transporter sub-family C-like protein 7 [Sarcoptes scabiei]